MIITISMNDINIYFILLLLNIYFILLLLNIYFILLLLNIYPSRLLAISHNITCRRLFQTMRILLM